ncbi:MAG: cytidylate kinase-like family protein [Treponema sp.]|nr:cytidylate kinase-like family protein [Treponema sp.]
MAILTISRAVASMGDEIAAAAAERLGYRFVNRKDIERRIVELGFPEEKLRKYDEKKPGFFASLTKDRDEYLDFLQTAVLEFASENNCILIGRGSSIILNDAPNHLAFRFIANDTVRLERLKAEFNWDSKQAMKRIRESDANRKGFHKSFFNYDIENPSLFHLVINTGLFDIDGAAKMIADTVYGFITPEKEAAGQRRVEELLIGQRIVNMLILDYHLNISFLRAVISGHRLVLHGVAESAALVEQAVSVAASELPDYKVESAISIVQDFKAYPQ